MKPKPSARECGEIIVEREIVKALSKCTLSAIKAAEAIKILFQTKTGDELIAKRIDEEILPLLKACEMANETLYAIATHQCTIDPDLFAILRDVILNTRGKSKDGNGKFAGI